MKYNKLLVLIMVMILAFGSTKIAADFPPSDSFWTWSDAIQEGDHFEWDVEYYINDTPSYDGNMDYISVDGDVPFVHDTNFTVDIMAPLQSINASAMTGTEANATFAIVYNNMVMDSQGLSLILVMPNQMIFDNGTTMNYFEYVDQTGNFVFEFDANTTTTNIDGDYFYLYNNQYQQNDYTSIDLVYAYDTGLLDHYSYYKQSGNTTVEVNIYLTYSSIDSFDLEYFSFSQDLNTGDIFTWDVLNFTQNGETVTHISEDNPVVNGSEVTIELLDEPENLNFTDPNLDPDNYFSLTIDGTSQSIQDIFDEESFFQFIFPVVFDFNGSVYNFFEYAVDNGEFDSGTTAILVDGFFTVTDNYSDEYGYDFSEIKWNATTGVMQSFTQESSWTYMENGVNVTGTSYIHVVNHDAASTEISATNSTTSDSIGLELPISSPMWFSLPIMAITMSRKFRKN